MAWQIAHSAPRDKAIWLYVPAYSWTQNEKGQITAVVNDVRLAQWNKQRGEWVDQTSGNAVYPSMWNDADPAGAQPDMPVIEA